jgi:hypothetical protein
MMAQHRNTTSAALDCGSSNTGSYEPAGDGRNIFNATQSMICILIHRNAAL